LSLLRYHPAMVPPWWPDEEGRPLPTDPCARCGREVPVRFKGFHVEHLRHVGWALLERSGLHAERGELLIDLAPKEEQGLRRRPARHTGGAPARRKIRMRQRRRADTPARRELEAGRFDVSPENDGRSELE
jgi:hypothetical protein